LTKGFVLTFENPFQRFHEEDTLGKSVDSEVEGAPASTASPEVDCAEEDAGGVGAAESVDFWVPVNPAFTPISLK
jgi:hypothetical protein